MLVTGPPLILGGVGDVLSQVGLLGVGIAIMLVLLVGPTIYEWLSDEDLDQPVTEAADEDREVPTVDLQDAFAAVGSPDLSVGDQGPLVTLTDDHKDALTPETIDWHRRAAQVDDQWVTTLRVVDYPEFPTDAYLSELFKLGDVPLDVTVDFRPLPQDAAEAALRRRAQSLDDSSDYADLRDAGHLATKASLAQKTYETVKGGERVYEQVAYVTVRGGDRETLRENVREVRATLQQDTADCDAWRVDGIQDLALQGASPVGGDPLDRSQYALAGAVGAALASPNRPRVLEEGGVEVGIHRDTENPVVVNQFERENGYAGLVVAEPGSGKSFASKRDFLWSVGLAEDRIGVIMEPMNNWVGVAEALDAKVISVGGDTRINPLEIRKPPASVIRRRGRQVDFLNERVQRALSFLVNFFAVRDVPLGDRRRRLEAALMEAYNRKGITSDPATFERESPTMQTVFAVLEDMASRPSEYVTRVEGEVEKIARDAEWLLDQLGPFDEGGQFEALGGQSDFNIRDHDVVYIDIPGRGSVGGTTSLLMQLMVSVVFERAKETSDEVVFPIDEARYIMEVPEIMSMLETFFRHHRHYDLSIRLITQTVGEFLQHDEAKFILEQTATKQFLRLEEMNEEYAQEFGLNPEEARFVQKALPGSEERGYAESLVGIDDRWVPVTIEPLDSEKQVIDFDPGEDSLSDLPGGERLEELSSTTERESFSPDLSQPSGGPGGGSGQASDTADETPDRAPSRGSATSGSSTPTSSRSSPEEESTTSSRAPEARPEEESSGGSQGTEDRTTRTSTPDSEPAETESSTEPRTTTGDDRHQADRVLDADWTPNSRASVFEHAVAIDQSPLSGDEKELRLQELYVRARLAGLEIEASELTEYIAANRDSAADPMDSKPPESGGGSSTDSDQSADHPGADDEGHDGSPFEDPLEVNGHSIPADALPPNVDVVAPAPPSYDDGVLSLGPSAYGGAPASSTTNAGSESSSEGAATHSD